MTRMASVVSCIRADCPSVQVLHVCVSLWVCVCIQRVMSCCCLGRGEEREGVGCWMYLFCYGKKRADLPWLSSQPLLPRSFPPQLQSITNPLPPFLKAAGLQTVKVQSDSDCGPVHGALCLDYTKLRPHKISRCVAASFRRVILAWDMASDSLCVTNLCCSMGTI